MNVRYVMCLRCAHAMWWDEHSALIFAVDCPRCGEKNQFGPGVYVPEFKGHTLKDVADARSRKPPLFGDAERKRRE